MPTDAQNTPVNQGVSNRATPSTASRAARLGSTSEIGARLGSSSDIELFGVFG